MAPYRQRATPYRAALERRGYVTAQHYIFSLLSLPISSTIVIKTDSLSKKIPRSVRMAISWFKTARIVSLAASLPGSTIWCRTPWPWTSTLPTSCLMCLRTGPKMVPLNTRSVARVAEQCSRASMAGRGGNGEMIFKSPIEKAHNSTCAYWETAMLGGRIFLLEFRYHAQLKTTPQFGMADFPSLNIAGRLCI